MQKMSNIIESFFTWVLMGSAFAIGAFFGFLVFISFADTFGCAQGNWVIWFCIVGSSIGGAQGFTVVKWIVMRYNKQVWERLNWTANAIKIPSIISDLSVILTSAAVGAVSLRLLIYRTIESFFVPEQMMVGKIGAIIGAVTALWVILFKRIKQRSFMKGDNH